ncbi:hypothetical protein A8709_25145 [Paenibacillus pectinilyticus]|uniref:DUF1572 domain-containing protein n=1 Tax=Paenibacillus pectinilyticus TaxID=512399 RepID=A0A1C1A0R3_9BACL|nr:DUF1572 family protein [Paenibacillus pectinilyticus]OCT14136.1 hypothetical protein A8709_25145 [Paenibacillus pectinilyticus]
MTDNRQVADVFLQESIRAFQSMKKLADKSFSQTADVHFYETLDKESNSLEVLITHMHGNMLSRWTDFLTSDGEKEWRDRDGEFEAGTRSREDLIALWEAGWQVLLTTLASLTPEEVLSQVRIRGESHTVLQAIQRQVSHYGYHVGQIVMLCKHWSSLDWQTLSIARGESKLFKPTI